MKKHTKLATKYLIRSAAEAHNMTAKEMLMLFYYSAGVVGHPNPEAFGLLMLMCKDMALRPRVDDYIKFRATCIEIPAQDILRPQPDMHRSKFLYSMIENFYVKNVGSYEEVTFYPQLADLFRPRPLLPVTKLSPVDAAFKAELKASIMADGYDLPSVPKVEAPAITPTFGKPGILWNRQQKEAFALIHKWLRTEPKSRQQIFRLFGYAGTGKTEMSKAIADFVVHEAGKQNVPQGAVLFAAYTGKASSVMRIKGCRGADTLHSLLYRPVIDPDSGLCTEFVINRESPLSQAAILIIDEGSMINEEMASDILSFGIIVLVLGDPGQLQPVKGEGFFTNAEPDYMMTDIERQAKDNPIIMLATRARKGLELKPGRYGDSVVYAMGRHVSDKMYMGHDQIICGLNATRKTINSRSRRINGKADKDPIYPVAGDRLMCLRNNKTSGLYNGTMWTSSKPVIQKIMRPIFKGATLMRPGETDVLAFKVRSLDEMDPQGKPYIIKTQCSLHLFNTNMAEPEYREIAGTDAFDFGYGATGHKTQGSQYDSVLLFEESSAFRDQARKHVYTTITRAAERITILL